MWVLYSHIETVCIAFMHFHTYATVWTLVHSEILLEFGCHRNRIQKWDPWEVIRPLSSIRLLVSYLPPRNDIPVRYQPDAHACISNFPTFRIIAKHIFVLYKLLKAVISCYSFTKWINFFLVNKIIFIIEWKGIDTVHKLKASWSLQGVHFTSFVYTQNFLIQIVF